MSGGITRSRSNRPSGEIRLLPTVRGLGASGAFLVLAAIGALTGGAGVIVPAGALGVVLVGAPIVAWWRARRTGPTLQVSARGEPSLVPLGARAVLSLDVRNTSLSNLPATGIERADSRWRVAGRKGSLGAASSPDASADTGSQALRARRMVAPSLTALVRLPPLPAGASFRTTSPVPTQRRGLLELGGLGVWVHDPFGLFGATVAASRPVEVAVHPLPAVGAPEPLITGSVPVDGGALLAGHSARPAGRFAAGAGELAELRPYSPGDRLHLLHWPALASHDLLVVRQFEPELAGAAHMVVDDRAGVHRRADFEAALATALAVAEKALALGAVVELSTLSGDAMSASPTHDGAMELRMALAGLLPARHPPGSAERPRLPSASLPPLPVGSMLVTTATALGSIPDRARAATAIVP